MPMGFPGYMTTKQTHIGSISEREREILNNDIESKTLGGARLRIFITTHSQAVYLLEMLVYKYLV